MVGAGTTIGHVSWAPWGGTLRVSRSPTSPKQLSPIPFLTATERPLDGAHGHAQCGPTISRH